MSRRASGARKLQFPVVRSPGPGHVDGVVGAPEQDVETAVGGGTSRMRSLEGLTSAELIITTLVDSSWRRIRRWKESSAQYVGNMAGVQGWGPVASPASVALGTTRRNRGRCDARHDVIRCLRDGATEGGPKWARRTPSWTSAHPALPL